VTSITVRTAMLAVLAACGLAACSGSNPGSLPAAPVGSNAPQTAQTALRIVIDGPRHATAHLPRRPRYVSPSTNGLSIQVWQHGVAHTPANALVNAVVDVSSGSAACHGQTGFPRTCTASFGLAPQSDDFAVNAYDTRPSGNVIPPGAHLLAAGAATIAVTAGINNALTVFLGGVVSGFAATASFVSLPNAGTPATVALVVKPTDFGNNAIVAGSNDPLANPIRVSLAETGGIGHANLALNGGTPSSTVTIAHTTDTLQLVYDGAASPGYGIVVTMTAPSVAGFGGASATVDVSPLFVSTAFYRPSSNTLTLPLGITTPVTLTELNAPAGQLYAATPSAGCSGIATAAAAGGTGAKAIVNVATTDTVSAGACTMTFSDHITLVAVPVRNGTSSLYLNEFPLAVAKSDPGEITAGPDGALWFTEIRGWVGRIPVNATPGSGSQIQEYPAGATSSLAGITTGPDGQLWFAECGTSDIAKIPVTATPGSGTQITQYSATTTAPFAITTGPDGNVWYGDFNANVVKRMGPSGTVIGSYLTSNPFIDGLVTGPDGALWFTECDATGFIGRITTAGVLKEFGQSRGLQAGGEPNGITAGSDGNIWFTDSDNSSPAIGRVTIGTGAIVEFPLPANAEPITIVSGSDGALWFIDFGNGAIGRIPTNATVANPQVTEYPIPTANSAPTGLTVGPDGALWFAECFGNKIGRLSTNGADIRSTFLPSKGHVMSSARYRSVRAARRRRGMV
jgi:streptogramin lyase